VEDGVVLAIKVEYSLVDEYASEFTLPQRTSRRPFSLRQLIRFLESIPRRFHFIPDMRPRFFETAQLELEEISVALQRAYPPPPKLPAFERTRFRKTNAASALSPYDSP
jgi:hypothetical protein